MKDTDMNSIAGQVLITVNRTAVFLFLAGMSIFLVGMPKSSDDYLFFKEFVPWFESHGYVFPDETVNLSEDGFPWRGIVESWRYRVLWDNSRLANLSVPFFLVLPKWVGSGIAVLSFAFFIFGSYRLSGVRWEKSPLTGISLCMWMFMLVWQDNMSGIVFQFNYVLPLGIVALLLLELYRMRRVSPVFIFMTAFVTGWWHEGISLPLLAAAVAVVVLFRKCRTRRFYVAIAGLTAGLLCIMLTPSFLVRTGSDVDMSASTLVMKMLYAAIYGLPYWIIAGLTAFVARKFRRQIEWDNGFLVFILVSGSIPLGLLAVTYSVPRMLWLTQSLSVTGILYVCNRCGILNTCKRVGAGYIASMLAIAVTLVHLGFVDYYTLRIRNSYFKAFGEYRGNRGMQSIFGDVLECADISPVALTLPDMQAFNTRLRYINQYLSYMHGTGEDRPRVFAIIPESLRNVTPLSGEELTGASGARKVGGKVFIPASEPIRNNLVPVRGEADYGGGFAPVSIMLIPFKSEGDGHDYYYAYVYTGWYNHHFKTLRGLTIETANK